MFSAARNFLGRAVGALTGTRNPAADVALSRDPNAEARTSRLKGMKTAGYRPSMAYVGAGWGVTGWGQFSLSVIRQMMADSHVSLCVKYLKAPIIAAEVHTDPEREDGILIEAEDGETLAFVEETFKRFWQQGIKYALTSLEYGYAPAEALYREDDETQQLRFYGLKWIHPADATPFVLHGVLTHIEVDNVGHEGDKPTDGNSRVADAPATGPTDPEHGHKPMHTGKVKLFGTLGYEPAKGAWFVSQAGTEGSPWYGQSCLLPAWWSWRLMTMPDGVIETIFKGTYRDALGYDIGRHPDVMVDGPQGAVFAGDLMRQMLLERKNGAVLTFNNTRDEAGEYQWDVQVAKKDGDTGMAELIPIGDWYDKRTQRGIGIPDEVITHEGATGGYSRSQVAALAYYNDANQTTQAVVSQFDDQVCKPLVYMNRSMGKLKGSGKYKVTVRSLFPEDKAAADPNAMPGGEGQPQNPNEVGQDVSEGGAQPPAGPNPDGIPFSLGAVGQLTAPDVANWSKVVTQQAPHVRIVGPSGSGKSTLAQAIAGSTPGKLFILDPVWEPGHWGGLPAVTMDADGNYGKIDAALRALLAEMKRRMTLLQAGQDPGEELTIIFDEVPDTVAELPNTAGTFIKRMAMRGRHSHMRLIGIGQSSRVESWGLGGQGDVAESFTTIYLGDKAIEQMPDLAGREHAGVLEWRGKLYPIDLSQVLALSQQPIDRDRVWKMPAQDAAAMKQAGDLAMSRDENTCPECGSNHVGYPRSKTNLKTCQQCKHSWDSDAVEMARKGEGRWLTVGAQHGKDGEKHGGSPVYVEDGKITKGAPTLKGRNLDKTRPTETKAPEPETKPPENETPHERKAREKAERKAQIAEHRKELRESAEYTRAKFAKEARKAGIKPEHLHQAAGDILKEDRGRAKELGQMLTRARRLGDSYGVNLDRSRATKSGQRHEDTASIKGFDNLVRDLYQEYPHVLPAPTDSGGATGHEQHGMTMGNDYSEAGQKLLELLQDGVPEPISEEDAYRQAFDMLEADAAQHREAKKNRKAARLVELDDLPFGRWVTMGEGDHGTAVYIDKDGTIEKGPPGTTGKKPEDLDSARQEKPDEPAKPRQLKDQKEIESWGQKHFSEWGGSLSEKQFQAVDTYMSSAYAQINDALRRSNGERGPKVVQHLDAALESASLPEAVTTYRGVKRGKLADLQPGQSFRDYGFTSTTPSRHAGEQFAHGALMEIHLPKGTKAAYLNAAYEDPEDNDRAHEQELLLARGTKFNVTGVRTENGRKIISVEVAQDG